MKDQKYSILIIDDSSSMLRALSELLIAAGYEVAGAFTGEEGYRLAKEAKPDLVLLDIILPDINGMELCRRMKAEPDLAGIYIILLSGVKNDSESQAQGLEIGADDFIAKSTSERELLARVQTMLRIKNTETRLSDALQELREKHRELLNTQTQLQTSQKKYEELFDSAPVGYCSFDRLGIIIEANLTAARQLGVERSHLNGMPLFPYIHDEDHTIFRHHLQQVFETKTRQRCEIRLYQQDGSFSYVLLQSLRAHTTTGARYECHTAVTDISDSKQAEKDLRESEERYRTLVENLQQKVFHKDQDSTYVTCNQMYARDLHLSPEELVGKNDYDFFPKELAEKYRRDDKQVLKSGETLNVEERYVQDGQESIIQTIKTPIRDSDGDIIGLLGIFWDITERKHAEKALQHRTFELAERVKELNCLYGMANLVEQTDISLEGILQGTVELIPPALQHPNIACARLTLDDREFSTYNFQETIWKHIAPLMVYNTQRGLLEMYYLEERPESHEGLFPEEERKLLNAVVGRLGRIIERRWTEEALEKSEQRFKVLVETMNEGLAAIDENAIFTYMNNKFCEMVGYACNELLGQSSFIIVVPQQQAIHQAQLDRRKLGEFGTYETLLLRKDGSHLPIILSGSPLFDVAGNFTGTLGIFTDISQLKRIEDALTQERYLLHSLMDNSPDYIYFKDREGRFTRLNKSGADRVLLDDPIQAVGRSNFDFFAGKHARKTYADEQQIIKTGRALIGMEEKESWPDGRETWVSTTKMPLYAENGEIIGTFGISRDITKHKQSEERQQFATQVLEILNRADQKIDIIPKILLMVKQFTGFEAVGIRLRDGEDFPYYETSGFPEKFVEDERFLCVRDQTGELLRDSDGNPYLECMCGNILCGRTNPTLPFFTEQGSFWTNSTSELLASTNEEERQARTRNRCNGEGYESVALVPLRSRNRSIGLIQLNDHRKGLLTPEFISFFEGIGASVGIALEHKQTEDEMVRLRNFMKNIIDSMPSVLVGIDREGCITHWNLQAEGTTGRSSEDVQGHELKEVFPQLMQYMEKVQVAIRQRRPQQEEKVINQREGEIQYADVMIYPLISNGVEGAVIRVDDVTERVRFEEMMIQSEKMLSVGGLAAGMAHELNNPLASILQNTQVILNRLTKNFPANSLNAIESGITIKAIKSYMEKRDIIQMLELIQSSGDRAAQIVADMLSFSRKSGSYTLPHDLRKLLDKTVELASHVYDFKNKYDFQRFNIIREYDPFLPEILCEQNQIQQVILNLLTNAVQAMSEHNGQKEEPKIILRTIRDNDMARVEIEDNGPGMSENIRKRVFEPFFTTKAVGVGTGLGLSVSYFIVTQHHNGTMSVESEPGKGAKFTICLPLQGKKLDKVS